MSAALMAQPGLHSTMYMVRRKAANRGAKRIPWWVECVQQLHKLTGLRRINWIKGEPIGYIWLSLGLTSD